ncbi:MAG: L-lactate dehydrogenase complex protein LldE [Candidatus Paceibacteria bacterium]|jgi:L-lactate dehydrogenase complex protein LldE
MKVAMFVTCLVDQFRPQIGLATMEVLRRAGCEPSFDVRQTCCGQPAFNSGYHDEAQTVARHAIEVFEDAEAIVLPSGSCTAMTRHWPELFAEDPHWLERAAKVASRCHELSSFLVRTLGHTQFGASYDAKVSWHDACHGLRDLGLKSEPRALLSDVMGLELIEDDGAERCCGFGGSFSVKFPELSVAMLDRKLESLESAGVKAVISSDVSCLMQIEGRLARRQSPLRTLHLAEVLAGTAT